jgi:hypothetical protein
MHCHITYSPTGRGRPCGAWGAEEKLRPHGTEAARRRHERRGEPLCGPCQDPGAFRLCGCPSAPLAALEQTLGLLCGFAWVPSAGWVHQ